MNRLKEIRTQRHLRMTEMAKLLGIPYTTYVGYEKEERRLNSDVVKQFSQTLNVSADYLLGETDDPNRYVDHFVIGPVDKDIIEKICASLEYDHIGVKLIQQYRSLSFEGQQKIERYVEDLIATGLYTRNTDSKVG